MVSKRVLIIEDDAELSEQLVEALQGVGYHADYCPDPFKGTALIQSNQYDIILLDNKMPEISGIEILKKLKVDDIRSRIFIISGRPFVERLVEEDGLKDIVSGVIPKPFNFRNLLEKIGDVI